MKHDINSTSDSWEKDPVWDLLRQSPKVEARSSFAADVVRAARLEADSEPWWKRFALPLTVGGLTTAATAAIALLLILQQPSVDSPEVVAIPASVDTSLEELDEVVRTEALLVAAENPSDFSDAELVALIGY